LPIFHGGTGFGGRPLNNNDLSQGGIFRHDDLQDVLDAQYRVLEAEMWLNQEKLR
jgi:hypothetical protein